MQFGISIVSLISQEAIDSVLSDIPFVASYQDDILIGAPSKKLHELSLQAVKERLVAHHF